VSEKKEMSNNEALDNEAVAITKKEKFYTQPWFIFVVATLAILIIFSSFIVRNMIVNEITLAEALGLKEAKLDYLEDDLGKYIDIDESDYKDYDLEVNIAKPTDIDVDNKIMELLAKNKGALKFDGNYRYDQPIAPGDKAYIWYVGYRYDKDGNRIETGLTNFGEAYPMETVIGSGNNVALGFDLGLLGKTPWDYTEFSKSKVGKVREGDVVYLTASYVLENGLIYDQVDIRIDLRDPDHEKLWGVGVIDILQEVNIGMTNNLPITLGLLDSEYNITYTKIEVNYVTRCEDKYITVETRFPYDDEIESLRNETVYFDIFLEKTLCYESAQFDDSFVKEILKMDESKLSKYQGNTLSEKCREYYKESLLNEYEKNLQALAEDKMWERFDSVIEIKKYPKKETQRVYDKYIESYTLQYAEANAAGAGYESIDEYIADALGLEEGSNWGPIIDKMVLDEVKEKLIFYYILRKEGLVPEGDKFKEVYRNELELDFEYYGKTREDFATEEAYEKALFAYEKELLAYYGEEFYHDSVYYNYASSKLIKMANIINLSEKN
jgi:hypothetical protein